MAFAEMAMVNWLTRERLFGVPTARVLLWAAQAT